MAARLRRIEADWRRLGVTRVRIFGSVARGEATDLSDVDLLLDLREGAGLLSLMAAKDLFEGVLGTRIDALTEGAIKPALRRGILTDAVDIMAVPDRPHRTHRRKRWRWRVYDLLDALDRTADYTAPHDRQSFRQDEQAVDAVLRNLARLGETTKFIPQSQQDRHPQVPWALLRDIRNLVAHDYFGIDLDLVWQTVRHELPQLRPLLQELAEEGEGGAEDEGGGGR
ncbi:hypothetical protein GCM10017783_01290 [Deinococcus piscis]|uniref:Polymerase nucleotidyl transferase domain-containing protein n=1 Tax=Deinococcus piscis TaxID=394230 RepID=A0ABQ3JWH9_9DEIO|nr:hypothetical protein GCM10017783_01290 [Deinococcus piscis]